LSQPIKYRRPIKQGVQWTLVNSDRKRDSPRVSQLAQGLTFDPEPYPFSDVGH
jgi:hypothetical protein